MNDKLARPSNLEFIIYQTENGGMRLEVGKLNCTWLIWG
jgi:hypothetical protein